MDNLLLARIQDAADICNRTNTPKFVGFLTPDEAAAVQLFARKNKIKYCFYGGYENALRTCFVALPDWTDTAKNLNIISAVTVKYRIADKLSHRDFLGAITGLGIKRKYIGDILCGETETVVFLLDGIKKYVLEQLTKVGSAGVNVSEGQPEVLPETGKLAYSSSTVASVRLDAVVSALLNTSRSNAVTYIEEKCVYVNSLTAEKCTKTVLKNDNITVRGKGKFVITELSDKTKKGRIILKYGKYL